MNRKLVARYVFWAITLSVMVFIFIMSGQTSMESNETSKSFIRSFLHLFMDGFKVLGEVEKEEIIESFQLIVRKLAHFSVYAILGVSSYSAIVTYKLKNKMKFFLSAGLCLVYAFIDEFHQLFVSGRAGRLYDVAIDFIGSITGILLVCLVILISKKLRARRKLNA